MSLAIDIARITVAVGFGAGAVALALTAWRVATWPRWRLAQWANGGTP